MSEKTKSIKSASPKVRKFARELGANINQIKGSQRAGRISEEDVKSFIKSSLSEKTTDKKNEIKNPPAATNHSFSLNHFHKNCPFS